MEEIESRLARIERRLDVLEARWGVAPVAGPSNFRTSVQGTAPVGVIPAESGVDLETLLASRWLPRVGAVAVVAALAYLISLGLQRGTISPGMVAVGIALVCVGVIALGLRLRNERAAFGHVLVGLGIGGLYVDAVGAHLYQNLIGSETMVGACLAISLSAMAYGHRRALPPFLGIGVFGGLTAALMPLTKGAVATSSGLVLLVTVPAFATAASRRWPLAIAATWLAAFASIIPILFAHGEAYVRLLPLDAVLLIALAATARVNGAKPFVLAASGLTGIASLATLPGVDGAWHLAILGLATVGVAAVVRRSEVGPAIALSGLGLALSFAPLGLPNHQPEIALATIAILSAAASFAMRKGGEFVAFEAGLAIAIYLAHLATLAPLPLSSELGLIGLLAVSTVVAAIRLDRQDGRAVAGLTVWGLATRAGYLGIDLPEAAKLTLVWTIVCAALLAVGFWRRYTELRQLGLAVAAVTVAKVILFDLSDLDAALKAIVLMGLGIVLLAGGYAYVRSGRSKGNLGP